jgi:hypothetical protein
MRADGNAAIARDTARLDIERERLAIDQAKAKLDSKFLSRHAGGLITASVSLAAIFVSAAQVYITTITKNQELQLSREQRAHELQMQETQHEQDFLAGEAQRKRELDLNAARLVIENRKAIFEDGSTQDREMFAKLLSVTFPPEVSEPLLRRIQIVSPKNDQQEWQARFEKLFGKGSNALSPDGKRFVTINSGRALVFDADSGRFLMSYGRSSGAYTEASFSTDGQQLLLKSADGATAVVDAATGKLIQTIRQ